MLCYWNWWVETTQSRNWEIGCIGDNVWIM